MVGREKVRVMVVSGDVWCYLVDDSVCAFADLLELVVALHPDVGDGSRSDTHTTTSSTRKTRDTHREGREGRRMRGRIWSGRRWEVKDGG